LLRGLQAARVPRITKLGDSNPSKGEPARSGASSAGATLRLGRLARAAQQVPARVGQADDGTAGEYRHGNQAGQQGNGQDRHRTHENSLDG
jgi:hypothetical protein